MKALVYEEVSDWKITDQLQDVNDTVKIALVFGPLVSAIYQPNDDDENGDEDNNDNSDDEEEEEDDY